MKLNTETITKLISLYREDREMLDIIFDALKTFEEYHLAIYNMETQLRIFSYDSMDTEDYKDLIQELDGKRTRCHNIVLTSVNMLNRIADKEGLPLIYEGIVSEKRPYRREVANAVLEYVEDVIKNRR